MEVIHCDNHLLAAIKPAGLATQPHETDVDNFQDRVKKWIKTTYDKPGNVFLEPIHRLDKPVSGIVLFARTSKALSRLQAQMRAQEISKTYTALVEGTLPHNSGTLEHFLMHGSHHALVHPEGKRAVLTYRTLARNDGNTLVEISLETGRYHQIRAQFSAIGHPIVGDAKYGSHSFWPKGGIALHHSKMCFAHPVTKQKILLENNRSL
jgi:23S rRNA pseudouridine1911/1915/1917 synthase